MAKKENQIPAQQPVIASQPAQVVAPQIQQPAAQVMDRSELPQTPPQQGEESANPAAQQQPVQKSSSQSRTMTTLERINAPAMKPASSFMERIPTQPAGYGAFKNRQPSMAEMTKIILGGDQMTPEQKEAEAKRERRAKIFSAIGDGISALANVYFTSKGSPNMYDPKTSMSAKTKEYWDKLNAQRKVDADKYNNALIDAYKADRGEQNARDRWNQQLEQWKLEREQKMEAERYRRDKDKADAKYRKEKDDADRSSREKIAADQITAADKRAAADRAQRQTQFTKKMEAMYGPGGSGGSRKSKYTFSLGRGKEQVSVNADAVNDANVKQIWDRLPEDVKQQAQEYYKKAKTNEFGVPVYARDENGNVLKDKSGNNMPVYQPLSKNEMLEVIGANLEDNPDLQNDIRELAGMPRQKKPNPMGSPAKSSNGKLPNPMYK